MQFISGSDSITVKNPQYGYTVGLNLSLLVHRYGQSVSSWDNGSEFDFRTVEMELLLPDTETVALSDFLRDADARTQPFTLRLPANSGFYPAGPDKTDHGDFTVALIEHNQSGMRLRPYKWFSSRLRLMVQSSPSTSIPAAVKQGPFAIGTVSGLRYPSIQPTAEHGITRSVTLGGSVTNVNTGADEYTTRISQPCNVSKAAALVDYLQTARGGDISVTAPANYYLFGADNGNSGIYTTRLLNNVIPITHKNFNQFRVDLELFKQA